jgi:hypothetical protein
MENREISTIKLKKQTKARLDHLRVYRRETYEEIMEKILNILNLVRQNSEQARARLISIDKQKRRVQQEQKATHKEQRKDTIKPQLREIKGA